MAGAMVDAVVREGNESSGRPAATAAYLVGKAHTHVKPPRGEAITEKTEKHREQRTERSPSGKREKAERGSS